MLQVEHRHPGAQRDRQDVDALIHGGLRGHTAKSETARIVFIVQMLAHLALLGTGIRVLLGGRAARPGTTIRHGWMTWPARHVTAPALGTAAASVDRWKISFHLRTLRGMARRAPGCLSKAEPGAGAGLDAELVVAVVHDGLVAQGAGGRVEPLGERPGAGAVVAGPAGLVSAGGGRGQDPGAGAAGVLAGPGHGHADGEVGVCGRGTGRPCRGGDGGLECPGEFTQRLALVVLALPVVALADVPAAVGVAGR